MDVAYRATPFEIKAEEDGTFEGYASVFSEVDNGMDMVMPGAFTQTLRERTPKMLWQHDTDKIIGKYDVVAEDSKGLFVKGRIIQAVTQGKEALTLLREGALDQMSIGFRTIKDNFLDNGVRQLTEVKLYEISLVTFAMLESAQVTGIKARPTVRDFERFLRDAGYSRKQAVAIANHGYSAIINEPRDADTGSQGAESVLASLKRLKETIHA